MTIIETQSSRRGFLRGAAAFSGLVIGFHFAPRGLLGEAHAAAVSFRRRITGLRLDGPAKVSAILR